MASKLTPYARALRKRMTPEEIILWARLRRLDDWKFRRQQAIGAYIVDFACFAPKIVIEIDGSQHGAPREKEQDESRDAWLLSQGFTVKRFWNSDIHKNLEGVLQSILEQLEKNR